VIRVYKDPVELIPNQPKKTAPAKRAATFFLTINETTAWALTVASPPEKLWFPTRTSMDGKPCLVFSRQAGRQADGYRIGRCLKHNTKTSHRHLLVNGYHQLVNCFSISVLSHPQLASSTPLSHTPT
jgi:hypothetical protein